MEIFTTDERKAGLKEKIAKCDGEYGFIGYCLKYEAQKAIGCPLYSVTYTKKAEPPPAILTTITAKRRTGGRIRKILTVPL